MKRLLTTACDAALESEKEKQKEKTGVFFTEHKSTPHTIVNPIAP